ncbi:MAG: hypothetical protein VX901_10720 [Candidatus Poribacteria bacterium]|nr:hypothetical protein [Candidatus Poribacteria bacterium]
MFKFNRLLVLVMLVLFSSSVVLAVEEFRVSKYGKGEQIWFEAEAFDERSPNENYKLGKAEKAVKPHKDAFGDIVTNAGGQGWLLYRFDISRAGGQKGKWRFIGRVINPSNHSDWLWVLGDDGDKIPEKAPAFVRPNHIIFEENAPPPWKWVTTGDFGGDGGTVNELQKGENVMMIWTRQSSLQVQNDVFLWSSDLEYKPTDDDYKKAKVKTLAVHSTDKLATKWGDLKSQ